MFALLFAALPLSTAILATMPPAAPTCNTPAISSDVNRRETSARLNFSGCPEIYRDVNTTITALQLPPTGTRLDFFAAFRDVEQHPGCVTCLLSYMILEDSTIMVALAFTCDGAFMFRATMLAFSEDPDLSISSKDGTALSISKGCLSLEDFRFELDHSSTSLRINRVGPASASMRLEKAADGGHDLLGSQCNCASFVSFQAAVESCYKTSVLEKSLQGATTGNNRGSPERFGWRFWSALALAIVPVLLIFFAALCHAGPFYRNG